MAKEWTFRTFVSSRKKNIFAEWLHGLPPKVRAKIKTRLKYLETTKTWQTQHCKKLQGYEGLYEIRIIFQSDQYRPIGCFGPNNGEFTILIGAIEKGNKFTPRNALETAYARSLLINTEECTSEYEY